MYCQHDFLSNNLLLCGFLLISTQAADIIYKISSNNLYFFSNNLRCLIVAKTAARMSLPERLKKIRSSLHMSQSAIAKEAGSSLPSWQGYESGKNVPGGKVLEALAKMGFNVNWILTGEEEMVRGKGGYYFEGFVFEERLFIDVVQAGFEKKGILSPESRRMAVLAYNLYRLITELRKDSLPEVDEIKGMYHLFTLFYEKLIEGESKFSADDIPKIIEYMVKGIPSTS